MSESDVTGKLEARTELRNEERSRGRAVVKTRSGPTYGRVQRRAGVSVDVRGEASCWWRRGEGGAPCAVGVHDRAPVWVVTKEVWDHLSRPHKETRNTRSVRRAPAG